MRTNSVLDILLTATAWVVVPVQLVTTLVLGLAVSLSFGLLLLPISLIWVVLFLGPLLALSWAWLRLPLLRLPIAVLGVPWALLGSIYVALVPAMGDLRGRMQKLVLCDSWPFSLEVYRWTMNRSSPLADETQRVLARIARRDQVAAQFLSAPERLPTG